MNRIEKSIIIIIILCLSLSFSSSATPVNQLKIHFINVGQADSILVQTTSGKYMLVDAGNNDDGKAVVDYLKKQGVKKLEYLVLTHPHEDHIGGADTVINTFQIGKVYMPKVTTTTKTFEDVVTAMKAKNLKATSPSLGSKFMLDKVECMILAPNNGKYDDLNGYSIVLKLTFGKTSFMLTGDADNTSEAEILKKKYTLKADVLKVGHHGSETSTSTTFLKAIAPKYAVISLGKDNDYGHPAKATLDRLASAKVQVYRTDLDGTIIATSNGDTITFDKKASSVKQNATPANTDTKAGKKLIEIVNIDLRGELVTIKNNSNKDVDLTGWKLVSVTGNQSYIFPKGYILKADKIITIASGNATGDLKWSKSNIWNNDGDPGQLYDNTGKLVSSK